jgi:hypothetical protein
MNNNSLVRNISIGLIITRIMEEKEFSVDELRLKLGITTSSLNELLSSNSIDTILLLKISKALRYDFFRLYSSHLMLHYGISSSVSRTKSKVDIEGVQIRKNVYTKELIFHLIKKVRTNKMSIKDVILKYGIPKTTFYKWLQKYPNEIKSK